MLSKAVLNTIFWVYGKTRPGIEHQSPGPLANPLLSKPKAWSHRKITMTHMCVWGVYNEINKLFKKKFN